MARQREHTYKYNLIPSLQRNIDKSRVTSIKWVPGSQNSFLAAHSSGCMYLYNYEILCPNTMPVYQSFKQGKGYAVQTCKTKTTRNPLYKWTIGKFISQTYLFISIIDNWYLPILFIIFFTEILTWIHSWLVAFFHYLVKNTQMNF